MASTQFTSARRIYSGGASITQATGMTITGWLKFSAFSPWGAVLNFGDIILGAASSEPHHVQLDFLSGGQVDSGYDAATTAWFFFAITWSGSTVTIKISSDFSTITNTASTTKAATWTVSSFEVGDYQNSFERYDGQIHHLRTFAAVLSDSEILAEMASTTAVLTAFAAWELNDASLNDLSGNDRHLTGTGGTVVAGAESAPVPEGGDITAEIDAVVSNATSAIAASSVVSAAVAAVATESTSAVAGGPVVGATVAAQVADALSTISASGVVSATSGGIASKASSSLAGGPLVEAEVSCLASKTTSQIAAGAVVGATLGAVASKATSAIAGNVATLGIVVSIAAVASKSTSNILALCEVGATINSVAPVAQSKIIISPNVPGTPLSVVWTPEAKPSSMNWTTGNEPKIIDWS